MELENFHNIIPISLLLRCIAKVLLKFHKDRTVFYSLTAHLPLSDPNSQIWIKEREIVTSFISTFQLARSALSHPAHIQEDLSPAKIGNDKIEICNKNPLSMVILRFCSGIGILPFFPPSRASWEKQFEGKPGDNPRIGLVKPDNECQSRENDK